MATRGVRLAVVTIPLLLAAMGAWAGSRQPTPPAFDHAVHSGLFPGSCMTCHAGVAETGAPLWPTIEGCAACHDGEVQPVVEWTPPTAPPPSNLRFAHDLHATAAASDSVSCAQCHTIADPKGDVHRSVVGQCIDCHQPGGQHLEVADQECATCHVTLAEATRLSASQVADFPVPASHLTPGFGLKDHGEGAWVRNADGQMSVAASCATCHAQNFCINCHVNAPEVPAIQALASDERSLVHGFTFAAPGSHEAPNFVAVHGGDAQRNPQSCATCHTQPSCTTCHIAPAPPRQVSAMHMPGPGRAAGASTERHPPASHTRAFTEGHGPEASAAPRACSTCHVREDCLSCHRPDLAQPAGGGNYHPTGFLVRHPTAAYARQTTCSDCHNAQQFCASCHAQAGLSATRSLGAGSFHDGRAAFIVGHGQAARQSLESCVSCHVERDCTACHSTLGRGFRFSPHGPGFDPERLRRRNPEMCIACHGVAIPGVPQGP
jgi:hypothetical protein